jgi:hypothetical protein
MLAKKKASKSIEGKDIAKGFTELVDPQQVEIKAEQLIAVIGSWVKLADGKKRSCRDQQYQRPSTNLR